MICPKCGYQSKPRSTGPFSASHHLHGHLATIAASLGYHMSEMKAAMKEDCPEWPRVMILGKSVPISEADATSVVEAAAIEWCHVRAAEYNIKLVESYDIL